MIEINIYLITDFTHKFGLDLTCEPDFGMKVKTACSKPPVQKPPAQSRLLFRAIHSAKGEKSGIIEGQFCNNFSGKR